MYALRKYIGDNGSLGVNTNILADNFTINDALMVAHVSDDDGALNYQNINTDWHKTFIYFCGQVANIIPEILVNPTLYIYIYIYILCVYIYIYIYIYYMNLKRF